MFLKFWNHVRLIYYLIRDKEVSFILKIFFIGLPLFYAIYPFAVEVPDYIPIIGLLDDFLLLVITSWVFLFLCPRKRVNYFRRKISQGFLGEDAWVEKLRNSDEQKILAISFCMIILTFIGTGATIGVLMVLGLIYGFVLNRTRREAILSNAIEVNSVHLPEINAEFLRIKKILPAPRIRLMVTQDPLMNAYTFGLDEPYIVVLTSGLLEKLTHQEIGSVIGHEIGHIIFGHTQLINLLGSLPALNTIYFYAWNRACEHSADAVGMYICGKNSLQSINALLKISSGMSKIQFDLQTFLGQSDNANSQINGEYISTHPYINNRIKYLLKEKGQFEQLQIEQL